MQKVVIWKKTCEGTLRQVFIYLRPRTPHPPPLHTVYGVYSILIHTGKGGVGWEFNQREGQRGNSSQSWVENSNLTDCISNLHCINFDKHLPQKSLNRSSFLDENIWFGVYIVNYSPCYAPFRLPILVEGGLLSVTDPVFRGSNLSNRYEDDR
jgi:hypothetical protein